MARYFLELAYKGTAYSGFQVQDNAPTIQSEVEKALQTLFRQTVELTGSSRTDAGGDRIVSMFASVSGYVTAYLNERVLDVIVVDLIWHRVCEKISF